MSSYAEALQDFYSVEVLGEAIYSALLGAARNDNERLKWGTLLQLETETKAWLRAPMVAHGVSNRGTKSRSRKRHRLGESV
jgi:hypothetical protein